MFGDEYPAVAMVDGVRMVLVKETRWSRYFQNEDHKMGCLVSRFMDGSAAITFEQFAGEWPTWGKRERADFCSACSWLGRQSDFPAMLRIIMEHGGPLDWRTVASSVARWLPQEEAFDLLVRALNSVELGDAANIVQAIALTKHPGAEATLRAHLTALWGHPSLWEDDPFTNWYAYGATHCIEHLVELGVSAETFDMQVRELASHSCAGNRDSCRRFLSKYFPWLEEMGQSISQK